jgi:hypothetical protein
VPINVTEAVETFFQEQKPMMPSAKYGDAIHNA